MSKITFLLLLTLLLGCDLVEFVNPATRSTEQSSESSSVESAETSINATNMMDDRMDSHATQVEAIPTVDPAQLSNLSDKDRAIALIANTPEGATHLANYPDWEGDAWQEEEDGVWGVDLYSEAQDEWLGWGQVNVTTNTVVDYFIPVELTAEQFQVGRLSAEKVTLNDPAILTRLGDLASWEYDTYYDRWDSIWYVSFWRGIEELRVAVDVWEDDYYISGIVNPLELSAEEAHEENRNTAIELAYQRDDIWEIMDGVDDWTTYAEEHGDNIWTVSFATTDRTLYSATVNVDTGELLESNAGE
jgi:hypothetical protein